MVIWENERSALYTAYLPVGDQWRAGRIMDIDPDAEKWIDSLAHKKGKS
jgi:hypothetical protein